MGWNHLRNLIIKIYGPYCMRCRTLPADKKKVHGDHIIPKSRDKSKRLDPYNIQVLCEECNCSIKHLDTKDYRDEGHILVLHYEVSKGTFERYLNKSGKTQTPKNDLRKVKGNTKVPSRLIYQSLPEIDKSALKERFGDYLTILDAISKRRATWVKYLAELGIFIEK